jgi:hypothetical protein
MDCWMHSRSFSRARERARQTVSAFIWIRSAICCVMSSINPD